MKKIIGVLVVCLLFAGSVFADSIDDLRLITEEYPPYNFTKDGVPVGYATDVLLLMLEEAGSTLTRDDVETLPWARGYNMALEEKNVCLFSMGRTEKRENLFKWVGPLDATTHVLFALKSRGIVINSIEDVKNYKTAVIRDDIGEQLLLGKGIPEEQLDADAKIKSNLLKLKNGRVDLWTCEKDVGVEHLIQNGFNPDDYEIVFVLEENQTCFGFHKDTSDDIINKLQSALDKFIADGTLERIKGQYTE